MDVQPPLTVRVCGGLCCALAGAGELAKQLPAMLGGAAEVEAASCMGRCDQAPVLMIGEVALPRASPESLLNLLLHGDAAAALPRAENDASADSVGYEAYRAGGGYTLAASVVNGEQDPAVVLQAIEDSGLRGWGAGDDAAGLWRHMSGLPAPRTLAVNIDEEPGSFKDRHFLERDPHRFLEGLLVAAQLTGSEMAAIHFRPEHEDCRLMLEAELGQLWAHPPCPLPRIAVREGEGHAPVINAYETLHWVRDIVEKGAGWFNRFGRNGCKGLRSYSIGGRVNSPGVKVAPAGITLNELIEEYCDGMCEGHQLYAWLPAGTWGSILPARLATVPLDHHTLEPFGCSLGPAAVVVLSWHDRARCDAFRVMATTL